MTEKKYFAKLTQLEKSHRRFIKTVYGGQPNGRDLLEANAILNDEKTRLAKEYHAGVEEE